jgi:hypothetical protein
MATYNELFSLYSDTDMINKCTVAVLIKADEILAGTPTTGDQKWAAYVSDNPVTEGRKAYRLLLAGNSGLTVAQIIGASDVTIQTKVDAVVPSLIAAFNA